MSPSCYKGTFDLYIQFRVKSDPLKQFKEKTHLCSWQTFLNDYFTKTLNTLFTLSIIHWKHMFTGVMLSLTIISCDICFSWSVKTKASLRITSLVFMNDLTFQNYVQTNYERVRYCEMPGNYMHICQHQDKRTGWLIACNIGLWDRNMEALLNNLSVLPRVNNKYVT